MCTAEAARKVLERVSGSVYTCRRRWTRDEVPCLRAAVGREGLDGRVVERARLLREGFV